MSASLNDCLQKMGMGIAFDDGADFSNMIKLKPGQRAKVSDVVHKTFIEVNEKGTEAAAATAVSVVLTSAMEPEPVSTPFVVDHPFVFGIRNRDTGAILFMGSIVDPQS
jgi:serpin B